MSAVESYRVLLIDDSATVHDDVRRVLQRPSDAAVDDLEADLFGAPKNLATPAFHFAVENAFQGLGGVAKAAEAMRAQQPFDLALVDLRMPPGIDGLATTIELWKIDPQLQVVLFTDLAEYSWVQMVDRLGQSDRWTVLQKPVDSNELLQLAHLLCRKGHLAKETKRYVTNLEHLVSDRSQALRIEQEIGTLWLEHTFDLAVMADARGKVVRASASHATQLGYSRDELLGRDVLFMAHPDDRASCAEALKSTEAGAVSPRFVRLRHKDGHYETFALHGACVENDLDEPVYSLAVMRKCEPAAARD